jgi:hypothetical protein
MASIRVHFSPGFTIGEGFPAEQSRCRETLADLLRVSSKVLRYTVACQARLIEKCARHNTHMVLCGNRIPPEQKNGFLRCSAYFQYRQSKNLTICSPGIRIPPEELSPEHPPKTSIRIPQGEPHFVALSAGATSPLLLRSLTTTLEQIVLQEILLLEEIQG